MRHFLATIAVLGLLLAGSQGARAQVVEGEVLDSLSGAPLGGGFVILEDAAGLEVARGLVASTGRFAIHAPDLGRYRLRWARVGFRSAASSPFELTADVAFSLTFRVVPIPVQLDPLTVQGERRCDARPGSVAETAAIWEEVQKALEATVWADEYGVFEYLWYSYRRDWDPSRTGTPREAGATHRAATTRPFATLDPAELANTGYVVQRGPDVWYYLPDAETLLHETFLDTHCFWVTRDEEGHPGLIGLGFEPVPERPVADVAGTLWLDEATFQLRTLVVRYTELPQEFEDERVGGTLSFLMLPSGVWIVRDWQIRTPILDIRDVGVSIRLGWRQEVVLSGFRDTGGRVLEVMATAGLVYSAEHSYLNGTVFDSTRGRALVGAEVRLAGTDVVAWTNERGQYRLAAPLDGPQSVVVSHPWLDSIGVSGPRGPVALEAGAFRTLAIGVPHVDSLARRRCEGRPTGLGTRVVMGRVRMPEPRGVDEDVRIRASWQTLGWSNEARLTVFDGWEDTFADEWGFYALCAVPVGRPVAVTARSPGATALPRRVVLPLHPQGQVLATGVEGMPWAFEASTPITPSSALLDLALGDAAPATEPPPAFVGVIADRTTGEALDAVQVVVADRDTVVSRPDGTFAGPVEWRAGTNRVSMQRLAYLPLAFDLWLDAPRSDVMLDFALASSAIRLDPVEVIGTAADRKLRDAGFYERRDIGAGRFLERPLIEERLPGAQTWPDLLRGEPGVHVRHGGRGMFGTVPQIRGIPNAQGCVLPRIFVDGRPLSALAEDVPDAFNLVAQAVPPEEIAAIEVYRRPTEIPPQYGGAQSGCGVILIWTFAGPG